MKRILTLSLLAMTLWLTGCGDKPISPAELPQPIQAFILQYFPGQTITFAQKDPELFGTQYDVVLTDGTRVEFDNDHEWDKISGTVMNPVPTALIPPPIVAFL